jgi:hypothetical protein
VKIQTGLNCEYVGLSEVILTLSHSRGIWGIFGQFISSHFGIVGPLSMFSINQTLFLQKPSLYIQIPNKI